MTVLTATVRDIAGIDDATTFTFYVPSVRQDDAGTAGLVTPPRYRANAVDGVLTTPDMEPGPAVLRISGDPNEYRIVIPASATPLELWPLIDAGMPPPVGEPGFVRNAGGIARMQRITESAYAALATPDPETLYITFEG